MTDARIAVADFGEDGIFFGGFIVCGVVGGEGRGGSSALLAFAFGLFAHGEK